MPQSWANLKQGETPTDKTNWSNQKQGSTREIIAEKAGVGMGSVQRLTEVQRDAPDLFEKVKAGEMSINKAYTKKKKRENGGGIAEAGEGKAGNTDRLIARLGKR